MGAFSAAFLRYPYSQVTGPALIPLMAIPLALGYLAAPLDRHANREEYRGTRWRVWMALFLSVGLFFGHAFAALSVMESGHANMLFSLDWLIATAVATCTAAGLAVFIARLRDDAPHSLGFVARDLKSNLWLGFRCGLVFLAVDLISFKFGQTLDLWQLGGTNAVRVVFESTDRAMSVIATFFAVVLVPFAEEILFRGVLFAALRRTCGVTSAVWLSALTFGLFHGAGWQMPFLLGILLGYLYHFTGSLWTCVVAHTGLNLAALGLGFNRGIALSYLSWTHVGAIVVAIGLAMLIRVRRAAPRDCVCGSTRAGARPRCPDCAYPLDDPPLWLVRLARAGVCAALVSAGTFCIALDHFAGQPYRAGLHPELLKIQYQVLKANRRDELASRLLADWRAARPDQVAAGLLMAQEAYLREDFAAMAKLVEPHVNATDPDQAIDTNLARAMLATALAEQGGALVDAAVKLARQAHESMPPEMRIAVEDALGWALLRAGQLEEARDLLDRDLNVYGLITRQNAAEFAYHKGVLLWSIGEEDRARLVLKDAAHMAPPIEPFTRRAKKILEKGALPDSLVPLLPPLLPER